MPQLTYFVDPVNGNNSNAGTSSGAAWKSVNYARTQWISQSRANGSMTSGSPTLTGTGFLVSDVGKWIQVNGAGAASGNLVTYIAGFTNATTVTLAANAGTTVASATYTYGGGDRNGVTVYVMGGTSRLTLSTFFNSTDGGSLAQTRSDGAITSGAAVLTGTGFASTDVGKVITVYGAGTPTNGNATNLVTFIAGYSSATSVTLGANAGATIASGGTYSFGGPVVIKAYSQQTPVITTSINVPYASATVVTNTDARWSQIPASVRGTAMVIDLTAAGVTSQAIVRRGWSTNQNAVVENTPYFNGAKMTKARWPKATDDYTSLFTGNAWLPRVGYVGYTSINTQGTVASGAVTLSHDGSVTVPATVSARMAGWNLTDVWTNGQFSQAWEWSINKPYSLVGNVMTLSYAEYSGVIQGSYGNCFFFENVLEEMTLPGEYYLDVSANKLYFNPPTGWSASSSLEITTPTSSTGRSIDATSCNYITWEGITFDGAAGNMLNLNGCTGWTFNRCYFKNAGLGNLYTTGSNSLTVDTCEFSASQGAGQLGTLVLASQGTGSTLTSGNSVVKNSRFHDVCTYFPAPSMFIDGVGATVTGNAFYNLPDNAISLGGINNVTISNNTFQNTNLIACDHGSIYSSNNNVLCRGNTIRNNYFSDIGASLPAQTAIYIDNGTMGTTIQYNTFVRCVNYVGANYGAVHLNSANDATITDNTFIECPIAVSQAAFFASGSGSTYLNNTLNGGTWYTSLSTAIGASDARTTGVYPEISSLANFVASSRWATIGSYNAPKNNTFARNWIADKRTGPRDYFQSATTTNPAVVFSSYNTLDALVVSGVPSLSVGNNSRI